MIARSGQGDLLGLLPGRETYVIDKDGVVRLAFNNQARLTPTRYHNRLSTLSRDHKNAWARDLPQCTSSITNCQLITTYMRRESSFPGHCR